MVKKLEEVRSSKRLAFDNLEVAAACTMTLKAQMKDADTKYARMVEDAAQAKGDLRLLIITL